MQGGEWFIGVRETDSEELADMFVHQPIVDHPADLAHGHDMLTAQDPQLMRNGGIITAKACRQITDTQFSNGSMEQGIEHLEPGRVGEYGEEVGSDASRIRREQVPPHCQGMFRVDASLLAHVRRLGRRPSSKPLSVNGHPIVSFINS